MSKIEESNTNISKSKYFMPMILIIIYIAIALLISVVVKFSMATDENNAVVSITDNNGDQALLNGKYDMAISEYNSLQQNEQWPIWTLKIGEVYSIQGDYKKSNEFIQKAYEARNKSIDTQSAGIEGFEEKDKELAEGIVINSFINGEYQKAKEYGEFFLGLYPDDSELLKAMFGVYIANNEKDEAKKIISNFSEAENDSSSLITAAKMNLLLKNYEEGLKQIENAYKLDENNIIILDTIDDAAKYNKDTIIKEINKLKEKDKNNSVYDLFLARVYCSDSAYISKADEIMKKLEEDYAENNNYLFTKVQMNINQKENKSAEKILDDIMDNNEGTYIAEYADSLKCYYEKKYDDAIKAAKRCIYLNKDYLNSYSSLIPSILLGQNKTSEEEPYLRIALTKEPFNFGNIITIAEYYKDVLQDSSKGLYYYTLASKINNDNAEIYYKMGLIQYKNQRIDEAVEFLKNSTSLDKANPKYFRALGAVYLETGKSEEGINQIRKAYDIDKEDIATLNDAAYYYIYSEHNVTRAMSNIKAAYEGIDEKTSESEKAIITDNYNRIKVLYDSSKKDNSSNKNEIVSEVKLIY
ncbi:hypothetical protein [uncultured Clostridium sp.]|uniref:tetratricopeptide repeat protein n=1 Tax=uncultured Clostridium sp. TaxID=59620 RepID=UPI0025F4B0A2|nr:hypothetical protein [uncultured Clostridium sp.]